MGYAYTIPLSLFECGNSPKTTEITFGTPGGLTYGLSNLDVPSWIKGRVEHAYLEVHFPWIINSAADYNWMDSSDGIYISPDSGVNYYKAIDLTDHLMYMPASSTFTGDMKVIGTIDIAQYVEQAAGSHFLVEFQAVVGHDNSITLYYEYCVLKCYLKGW